MTAEPTRALDLSLGEFEALATKAIRGAGYPWGLARDGAFAARCLAASGVHAVPILIRLLDQTDGRPLDFMPDDQWSAPSQVLCPVCTGAALSDAGIASVTLSSVAEPVLLAAVLSFASMTRTARLRIAWANGAATVLNGRLFIEGAAPGHVADVAVSPARTLHPLDAPSRTRALVDQASLDRLLDYAGRTYAPATEASRSGAGPS